ncbi:hypothetical protein B0H10DRAFT_1944701 [Mycena sp. CBHHK59/15]|nr:hypothetical protein B0H10DRAFT_1944701 [Mycena sp. CBHHK59/15]
MTRIYMKSQIFHGIKDLLTLRFRPLLPLNACLQCMINTMPQEAQFAFLSPLDGTRSDARKVRVKMSTVCHCTLYHPLSPIEVNVPPAWSSLVHFHHLRCTCWPLPEVGMVEGSDFTAFRAYLANSLASCVLGQLMVSQLADGLPQLAKLLAK